MKEKQNDANVMTATRVELAKSYPCDHIGGRTAYGDAIVIRSCELLTIPL